MFDPYHKWLGIHKKHRPPTHYQLLGIEPEEDDPEVIEEAAIRQSAHLRTYQIGAHGDLCTRLLDEVSQARTTLLNPRKRAHYDAELAKKAPKPQQSVQKEVRQQELNSAFANLDDPQGITTDRNRASDRRDGAARSGRHRKPAGALSRNGSGNLRSATSNYNLFVWIGVGMGGLAVVLILVLLLTGGSDDSDKKGRADRDRVAKKGDDKKPTDPNPPANPPRDRNNPPIKPNPPANPPPDPNNPRGVPIAFRFPDGPAGREVFSLRALADPNQGIGDFCLLPNGKEIVLSGRNVEKFDLATRKRLWGVPVGHRGSSMYSFVASSADGKKLYSVGQGETTIRVLDVETGQELKSFGSGEARIMGLELLPDGKRIASLDFKQWRLWDVETGAELFCSPDNPTYRAMTLGPKGEHLWTVRGEVIEIWDVRQKRINRLTLNTPDYHPHSIAVAPDGDTYAAYAKGSGNRTGILFGNRITRKATLRSLGGGFHYVYDLCFSPDGKQLVHGEGDGQLQLWDVATKTRADKVVGHHGNVFRCRFHSTGKQILACDSRGNFKVFPVPQDAVVANPPPVDGSPRNVATISTGNKWLRGLHLFEKRSEALFAGSRLELYDLKAQKRIRAFNGPHGSSPEFSLLQTSRDGRKVIGVHYGGPKIGIWDFATGDRLGELEGHRRLTRAILPLPDNKHLLSVGTKTIRIWDLTTKEEVFRSRETLWSAYTHAALSPDGKQAFVAGGGGVEIWDLENRKHVSTYPIPALFVSRVAVGADGTLAMAVDRYKDRFQKTPGSGIVLRGPDDPASKFVATTSTLRCLHFSPDGKLLVGGGSGILGLWDPKAKTILHQLSGHSAVIDCVRFAADGKQIFSCDRDGVVKIWQMPEPGKVAENPVDPPPVALANGKEIYSLQHPKAKMLGSFTLLPKEQQVILGGFRIERFDLATRRLLIEYDSAQGGTPAQTFFQLSEDGAIFYVVLMGRNVIRAWRVSDGKLLGQFEGHERHTVRGLALLPKRKQLVSLDHVGIRLWDLETQKQIARLDAAKTNCMALAVTNDGERAVVVKRDGLDTWNLKTKTLARSVKLPIAQRIDFVIAPDGTYVICSRRDVAGNVEGELTFGHCDREGVETVLLEDEALCLSVSSDGRSLLVGGRGKVVYLWDLKKRQPQAQFVGHDAAVQRVRFMAGDRKIASCDFDGKFKIWEVPQLGKTPENPIAPINDPEEIVHLQTPNGEGIGDFVVLPKKNQVILGHDRIETYSLTTKKLLRSFEKTSADRFPFYTRLQLSSDGTQLVSLLKGSSVTYVHHVATGKLLGKIPSRSTTLARDCALLPNGRQLVLVSSKKMWIWDHLAKRTVSSFVPEEFYAAMDVSPNGNVLVAAEPKQVDVVDLKTGKKKTVPMDVGVARCLTIGPRGAVAVGIDVVRTKGQTSILLLSPNLAERHRFKLTGTVYSVDFSADEKYLLASGSAGLLGVWDLKTYKRVYRLEGLNDYVTKARFSADGRYVYACDTKGSFKIWKLPNRTVPVRHSDELLVNGSFEEGEIRFNTEGYATIRRGEATLKGWEVADGGVDVLESFAPAKDGARCVDLSAFSPGRIRQTFATKKGKGYRVTFAYGGFFEVGESRKKFQVRAARLSAEFAVDTNGKSQDNPGWRTGTLDFTAREETTTLEFVSLERSPNGPYLDQVSVRELK